jgi:GxxExxY protein
LQKGFKVDRQKELPVKYRGVLVEYGFRIDLIVNDLVIVEVKAV